MGIRDGHGPLSMRIPAYWHMYAIIAHICGSICCWPQAWPSLGTIILARMAVLLVVESTMLMQLDARVIMGRLQRRKPQNNLDRPQDQRKADSEVSSAIGSVKTKPRSQVRKMANVIEGRISKRRDYELGCRVCSTCSRRRSKSTLMRMAKHHLKSSHLINPFHTIRSYFSFLLCR